MPKSKPIALCILFLFGIFAVGCKPSEADYTQWLYPNTRYVSTDGNIWLDHLDAHSVSVTILRRDTYLSDDDIATVNAWYQPKGWEHIATWRDRYLVPGKEFEIVGCHISIEPVISVILDTHPTQVDVAVYWLFHC